MPQNITCYIFRQQNPPTNWDPVRFGPWEPVNVLFAPEIPSKHTALKQYKVLLMYVPTSQPIVHNNWMGYRQYATARIKAICCGPSQANCCPVGARTAVPGQQPHAHMEQLFSLPAVSCLLILSFSGVPTALSTSWIQEMGSHSSMG